MEVNSQTDESPSVDQQRSEYEQFSMTVCANGIVNIRNDSYGADANSHIYSVDPIAETCSCSHHRQRNVVCKHIRAVGDSPIVLSSAQAAEASYDSQMLTDGGSTTDDSGVSNLDTNESSEPAITYHRESPEVGGQRYARCEGCGIESVEDSQGETSILHNDGCPYSNVAGDDEVRPRSL